METKEAGQGNAIHGPCLDFGSGLKTAIENIVQQRGNFKYGLYIR